MPVERRCSVSPREPGLLTSGSAAACTAESCAAQSTVLTPKLRSAPAHRRVLSRRPGTTEGMSKGMGRWAIARHLSAADERFGLRLGAGLDRTLAAAVTFALLLLLVH